MYGRTFFIQTTIFRLSQYSSVELQDHCNHYWWYSKHQHVHTSELPSPFRALNLECEMKTSENHWSYSSSLFRAEIGFVWCWNIDKSHPMGFNCPKKGDICSLERFEGVVRTLKLEIIYWQTTLFHYNGNIILGSWNICLKTKIWIKKRAIRTCHFEVTRFDNKIITRTFNF